MKRPEEAVAAFRAGHNCAQAVLRTHWTEGAPEEQRALELASGFGAGMRRGATCGAVTGAIMALGLRAGFRDPSDAAGKARIAAAVTDFCARFEATHGSLDCRELLGCSLDVARARGLLESRCPAFVEAASRILDEVA